MSSKSAKILLTGLPGCGKTTAIMKIIAGLNCRYVAGFYTEEIRENDHREILGFVVYESESETIGMSTSQILKRSLENVDWCGIRQHQNC